MKTAKTTPLLRLQQQKARLQARSSALQEALTGDLEYLQRHIGPLIGQSLLDVLLAQAPPFLRTLLGRGGESSGGQAHGHSWVSGLLNLLPLFVKGRKGWLLRLVVRWVDRWVFR
jgi:hypothetical protein